MKDFKTFNVLNISRNIIIIIFKTYIYILYNPRQSRVRIFSVENIITKGSRA